MKQRLELPTSVDETLKKVNLFAVDDYLRLIQSEEDRQRLILRVGYSPEKRRAYEKRHQLPRGAVEAAMMIEDQRYKELNRLLVAQMTAATQEGSSPEKLAEFYQRATSISLGLSKLYPEAQDFFLQHLLLRQSNHRHFLGDHRFSNEYRLQLVSSWCPSLTPVNCNVWINLGILLNVVAIALLAIAAAVCFFGPGWPALYGPNLRSLR